MNNSSSNHPHPTIMQSAKLKPSTSKWFLHELLKRTDTSNGDVCLFHYPMATPQVPFISMREMQLALEELVSLTTTSSSSSSETEYSSVPPEYMERAQVEARNRITRIQFCWYQFTQFPRLVDVYVNIQHVDIRQNASLTSIDSIITQLPNLTSLNMSDCPNVRTLLPLASVVSIENDATTNDEHDDDDNDDSRHHPRLLALKHLWVRGCNLNTMSNEEWASVFDALAESTGPLERLTLSRNNMSYLHGNIGKLTNLTYLFIEDNNTTGSSSSNSSTTTNNNDGRSCSSSNHGFIIPEEIGALQQLRFASLCGNNITRLPRQMAHLNVNCDVYLHRNPNLRYPPPPYQKSIQMMRQFFHQERMRLLRGSVLLMPHVTRARWRALERLYRPGGSGYVECKERFEEAVRRTSIT